MTAEVTMNKIKDLPRDERPYEKCFEYGPEFLTDTELLAVILRTGIRGLSSYELSKNIIESDMEYDGILSIMHLTKDDLIKINGVGKVKTVQVLCIAELVKRISAKEAKKNLKMDQPGTIAGYYMERVRHLEKEHLIALFLDTKCNLICEKTISIGTVNQSLIGNREILIAALKCGAVNMILIHNHPSGDPQPSTADIAVTKKINLAADLVGVKLLDHIIIGDINYVSFKEDKIAF